MLRHAKSSWDDPNLNDFNRPLNERGWKAARRIGRELGHRRMTFDLVLASTATRVRETIEGVQENHEFAAPVRFEPLIYLATAATLLSLVRDLPETVEAPLLVGHNPGLAQLLMEMTSDDSGGLRRRIAGNFPTGALAVVELPADEWAGVAPGSGAIVELILPKELD
jgi:phosphohistidine phosphatase